MDRGSVSKVYFQNGKSGRQKTILEYSYQNTFFNFQNDKSAIHKMCYRKYIPEIF